MLHVRFRGGATTTLRIPIPLNAWRKRQTHPKALARAEVLLQAHTSTEVAAKLNEEGFTTGAGAPFDAAAVNWLEERWGLKTYRDHLLAAGKLTTIEMAKQLGINARRLRDWRLHGRLSATRCNDKGEWLYDPIEQQPEWIQRRRTCYATAKITTVDQGSPHL